jgi:mono/diheme cytochrome c family protein
MKHMALGAAFLISAISIAQAAGDPVARGKYLVAVTGCNDCHTPGALLGKPDMTRFLAGAEVGFAIPGLGVFAPNNLTPDKETGLGNWTNDQIATAITKGVRPDGRILAPTMPSADFANLTKSDAMAIAVYLKRLPAMKNKVAGPFGPTEKPTILVMTVVPPEVYATLPKPPPGK